MSRRAALLLAGALPSNALLLVLPCLALGLQDRAATWRIGWFLILVTAACAVDCLAPDNRRPGPARHTLADRHYARLALASGLCLLLVYWSALVESRLAAAPCSWLALGLGTFLACLGILLRALAIGTLRTQFRSEVSDGGQGRFIRSGIYRALRHPSEAGLLLLALGVSLVLQSWLAGSLTLTLLLPLTLMRIAREEQELTAAVGPQYAAYRQQVPSLIPRI
jgi:protein-S-isoprenylcysteine O-methyltransferase Ste14